MEMLSLLFGIIYSGAIENYAVIMCGSRGWSNYRHQADVYTWRKILINRGFTPSNVITLSYNDIIERTNKTIYHTCNGTNVYEDGAINYTREDANKQNFFNVLSTIPSGKGGWFKREINVLVVYINHGARDMLSTPNAFDQPIYTDEFSDVVNSLAKRVNRIFCIIEACHSGSIAMNAKYARNVMFMTAATTKQPSYSYGYCEPLDAFTTNEMTYHILNYLDDRSNNDKNLDDMIDYARHNTNLSYVIRSGLTKRIKLRDFFQSSSRDKILGDTTIHSRKRRNVNNLIDPRLVNIYNRIRRTLITNMEISTIDRSDETRCRKRISSIALRLFVNDYLHEDNIEFLNMVGDLCHDYTFEDIYRVLRKVNEAKHHHIYNGMMHWCG
jgi:glycosylphosphatidylinositol transamidase (GPIT) subunit GPI8